MIALLLVVPRCDAQASFRGSLQQHISDSSNSVTTVSNHFPDPCIIQNIGVWHARLFANISTPEERGGVGVAPIGEKLVDDQKWHITSAGNGTYIITNAGSGMRLYAGDDGLGIGAVRRDTEVEADQKWFIMPAGNCLYTAYCYTIVNAYSGKRLYTRVPGLYTGLLADAEEETEHDDIKWEIISTVLDKK